ncbi:hypothetical protein [Alkalicoccus urumqiensis]|uniref:DUF4352 domain-containing protein n=1 Tax=Alkalicoccus urumqiensis TaxID=1548213 RepID=A0A2P6ME28_ALKUR|nr:hypothetical protein [Alkalicoccus urumqiensis]PRO64527.1 hypothetical protein C6I21_14480 [Alkalicoccus urumqiensis]
MRTLHRGLAAFMLLTVVTACSQTDGQTNDEEAQAANTESTSDEGEVTATTEQDDFQMTLTSAKKVYEEGEPLDIFGSLTYLGEKEEIEITYDRMFYFSKVIDYKRYMSMTPTYESYRGTKTFSQGEAYEFESFEPNGNGEPITSQSEEELEQTKQLYEEITPLPAGGYTFNVVADFEVQTAEGNQEVRIPASIDIVVEPS